MAKSVEALVKPELLRWGRRSAGLDIAAAARKAQVTMEAIEAWESGTTRPTVAQLRTLGKAYRRPIAVFYLPEPPTDFTALHDFRRSTGAASPVTSAQLILAMRLAQSRRELLEELYEDLDLARPAFTLSATLDDEPETVAKRIRQYLGVTRANQEAHSPGRESMNWWRSVIEAKEILVFQMEDVPPGEARGFSIYSDALPAIVMNVKDAYNGRIFTMLHELCHLALRQAGICDLREHESVVAEDIEVFCNAVAGATLVPQDDFLRHHLVSTHHRVLNWNDEDIESLARTFRCSREVIVRRLLTLERVTREFYEAKRNNYIEEHSALNQNGKGGPQNQARKIVSTLGELYVRTVLNAFHDETIHAGDVAELFGTRLKHLNKIQAMATGS